MKRNVLLFIVFILFACKNRSEETSHEQQITPVDFIHTLVLPTAQVLHLKGPVLKVKETQRYTRPGKEDKIRSEKTYTFNREGFLIKTDKPLLLDNTLIEDWNEYSFSFDSNGRVDTFTLQNMGEGNHIDYINREVISYDLDSGIVTKKTVDSSGKTKKEEYYHYQQKEMKLYYRDTVYSIVDSLEVAKPVEGGRYPPRKSVITVQYSFDSLGRMVERIADAEFSSRHSRPSKTLFSYNDKGLISRKTVQRFEVTASDTIGKKSQSIEYLYTYDDKGNWIKKRGRNDLTGIKQHPQSSLRYVEYPSRYTL